VTYKEIGSRYRKIQDDRRSREDRRARPIEGRFVRNLDTMERSRKMQMDPGEIQGYWKIWDRRSNGDKGRAIGDTSRAGIWSLWEIQGVLWEILINTREILIKRFGEITGTFASDTERFWEIQGRYREEYRVQ
jgi:hypothetical protein